MADRQPLVSVVVPSFNYARFLSACLDSITQQDYRPLELIVIDDASSDDSWALLESYADSAAARSVYGGRIRIVRNERNLGAHASLNRGIALAKGDLIAIINADDLFGPNRLSRMVSALATAGGRFAFSRVVFVGENGDPIDQTDPIARRLQARQDAILRFPTVGFACLSSNVAISTGNFLFEKRLQQEIGQFSDLKFCHDWDFLLRAIPKTEPVYVSDAHYLYRVHGKNTFRSLDGIAARDTSATLRAYFERIAFQRTKNAIAPTPECWPGVFEIFMTAYGLWQYSEIAPPQKRT
jgi:glycosyltransferase involved in cell wall biosynthesis